MLLLEEGANPNSKDDDGKTPLLWATQNRHAKVVMLLLEDGADPSLKDNQHIGREE